MDSAKNLLKEFEELNNNYWKKNILIPFISSNLEKLIDEEKRCNSAEKYGIFIFDSFNFFFWKIDFNYIQN